MTYLERLLRPRLAVVVVRQMIALVRASVRERGVAETVRRAAAAPLSHRVRRIVGHVRSEQVATEPFRPRSSTGLARRALVLVGTSARERGFAATARRIAAAPFRHGFGGLTEHLRAGHAALPNPAGPPPAAAATLALRSSSVTPDVLSGSEVQAERLFVFREGPRKNASLACVVVTPRSFSADGRPAELLARALSRLLPGLPWRTAAAGDPSLWAALLIADVVVFVDFFDAELDTQRTFDAACFELHRRGVCTVFLDTAPEPQPGALSLERTTTLSDGKRDRQRRRCHYVLLGSGPAVIDSITGGEVDLPDPAEERDALLRRLVDRVRRGRLPHVAVISVLYRKADVVESFLEHVTDQTYPGEITTVLVDDCSPEDDAVAAETYEGALGRRGIANRRVLTVRLPQNSGNCASRLAGVAAVEADIYVVIDCDCLINRDFVAAHVFEHWFDDVDVVIGPLNVESGGRDAARVVKELEADPRRIPLETEPQDPVQADAFVNCITRNFSIKRRAIAREPLFDLDFSYSSKPGSGFGWEDVEMGYRLYARGSVIRYTPLAFSVHCSHPSSVSEAVKLQGSMRNFERLFAKHPDMALVARRWAVDTYDKLVTWQRHEGIDGGEAQHRLEARFAGQFEERRALLRRYRRGRRPLRILSYRWHVPHQYELYKLPHEFTLATNIGNGMVDAWAYDQRPLRPNVRFVPGSNIDPRDFDVAILHFDENVLASHNCNGVIPPEWGNPFRWLLQLSDIPKIGICHGTPQFIGQYGLDPGRKHTFVIHERERQELVDTLNRAEVKVVCNSWQALAEWGFADARVIWHGFDPQEFPAGSYQRDVLSLDADPYRPHYRGAWELLEVKARLDPTISLETAHHPGAALEPRDTNAFAVRNFRSYVDRIRQFTAYLNTTLRSPMPRSRGEAMMTGVIPVSLRNHDVDRFIRNGVDGFYANTPEELADFLNYLFRNREAAIRIGHEARRTALDVFNHDRYLAAWTGLLNEAIR